MSMHTISVPMEQITWDEIGHQSDPSARLATRLEIGGYPLYLEALAVTEDENGIKTADYEDRQDDLEALEGMENGRFMTTEMKGRDYVIFALPYCN